MKRILLLLTLFTATLQLTFAQRVPVTVNVTDETGSGLPGANVLIKGTSDGGITDATGKLTLNATPDAVLQISSIGYVTKEITVGNQTVVNHQMVLDVTQLTEVVVTGYATEQKKDIVGSVTVVKSSDLLATPAANVASQLQGRSPGVTVQTDGTPGGSAKVRIRGFGSFGSSDPLYVIDGVPVTVNVNSSGDSRSTSPIDNLNPNDIESLQVLKDAAAAAIYGARAANGVVIITTKRGASGAAKITYDGYYGSNYVSQNRFPDLLNAQEYGDMYWTQMKNAGIVQGSAQWTHPQYGTGPTPVIPEYILVTGAGATKATLGGTALEKLKNGSAADKALFASYVDPATYNLQTHQIVKSGDTDWFKEVYHPAMQQSHQIGASGGSDKGNYALSLNYFSQDNTSAKTNYFNRYTIRSNSSYKIRENIRVGENLQVTYQASNNFSNRASTAWTMSPLIPIYNIAGDPAGSQSPGISGDDALSRNPVTEPWRNRYDRNDNWGIFGNAYAEVDIIKGLTARTSFGIDQSSRRVRDFAPRTFEHAENTNQNSLAITANNSTSWTWTNTLKYNHTFAEKHNFGIMVGSEAINSLFESTQATRQDYNLLNENNPDFQILNAGIGTQTNSGDFERNALYSLFTRVDYSYGDKYLFNATVRRDQSSKFAQDTRTAYFPSAAVGWRLSSEEFLKGVSWLNDLKLRASYGIIGNQTGLPYLNQYTTFASDLGQSYPIAGSNSAQTSSFTQSRIGNPVAKWEENVTTNIGLDATLFNNSLDFTMEWYQKETNGLLVANQPAYTGATGGSSPAQPTLNAGDMKNVGIDLGITKRGNIIDGFRYEVGLTFSHYKNTVTKVSDNPLSALVGGSTREGNVTLTSVGNPISMYYGYQIEGFWKTQEEVDAANAAGYTSYIPPKVGRWKIQDVDGNGVINSNDRKFLGSPHPKFQLGANINLAYKNFDLTAFFFVNYGNKIYNQSRYSTDFNTFNMERSARMLYESWTPELGDKAKLPILDLNDTYSNQSPTSYYVEDASYIRLKTLQLGYTFPKAMLSKLKVDKLRLYVQSQNLFTLTKKEYTGLDPDAGLSGADLSMGVVNTSTPTPQQILFGVSLGF